MKKLIGVLLGLSLLVTSNTYAKSRADMLGDEFLLNQASAQSMVTSQLGTQVVQGKEHVLKLTYDYSVLGGSVGAKNLKNSAGYSALLPKGAIVRNCIIDVITAPTSTSTAATISLGTGVSAVDLKAATVIASYTGLVTCIPVGSAATAIKLTQDYTPTATIGSFPLTAGKINVMLQYELSDTQ
jgi:hypothetical protein